MSVDKKIAICISGEMRMFDDEYVKDSFYKFIGVRNPDIFISTWNHIGVSMNHGTIDPFLKKEHIDESELKNNIHEIYKNVKNVEIENYNDWIESLDSEIKDVAYNKDYDHRTVNCYSQLYKIYKANLLKSVYEKENDFKYDIVIRSRPDNLFVNHLESIVEGTVYNINIYGPAFYPSRLYDIFFYGDSESMDVVSNTFLEFENLIDHSFNNGLCKRDCCRLLYLQCMLNDIKVETTEYRLCDVFRSFLSYEEYINILKGWGGL